MCVKGSVTGWFDDIQEGNSEVTRASGSAISRRSSARHARSCGLRSRQPPTRKTWRPAPWRASSELPRKGDSPIWRIATFFGGCYYERPSAKWSPSDVARMVNALGGTRAKRIRSARDGARFRAVRPGPDSWQRAHSRVRSHHGRGVSAIAEPAGESRSGRPSRVENGRPSEPRDRGVTRLFRAHGRKTTQPDPQNMGEEDSQ